MSRRCRQIERRAIALHEAIADGKSAQRAEPLQLVREKVKAEIEYSRAIRWASYWADTAWHFRDGKALDATLQPAPDQRPKLEDLPSHSLWKEALTNQDMVKCGWTVPPQKNLQLLADFIRPPVEAVSLASEWLKDVSQVRQARRLLSVGLGPLIFPSILSEQVSVKWLTNLPVPFNDFRHPAVGGWDATMINVSDRQQHHVAAMLYPLDRVPSAGLIIRKVRRAKGNKSPVPIADYVEPFQSAGISGCPLVVMAGLESYGDLNRYLTDKKLAAPLLIDGRDTTTHPVWLDYEMPPWMPRYLPKLTGRLMSLWRWS